MKPFDLQEALNGAPVKLRNGNKAFITFNLSNLKDWSNVTDRPLIGHSLNKSESLEDLHSWTLCGWSAGGSNLSDIIGMWEEPKLTTAEILEKAYQEDLLVFSIDHGICQARVVGKHKNGNYIICAEGVVNFVVANIKHDWMLCKPKPPESNNVTLTLPRPYKPKKGEKYFFIRVTGLFFGFDIDEFEFDDSEFCINHSAAGRCFRTKSDAQAWLDAMKNALDD